ncbi:MAG: Stealth CR1 domain-containing protein [Syntrophobacteraceae bacterium]
MPNTGKYPVQRIDFVYTWVDGADPEYGRLRDQWAARLGVTVSPERDRDDLQLLRYSLRSLEKFVGWHGRVFIVTARPQVPSWLNLSGDCPLRIVHHDEIFEEPPRLPTFNSFAIEHNIHRIEGLSRHFVYANDDYFFGCNVKKSDFMTDSGELRVFLEKELTPDASEIERIDFTYAQIIANTNAYLDRLFGRKRRRHVRHWPLMIDKSLLKNGPEIRGTVASRFRCASDIALEYAYCHTLLADRPPKAVVVPYWEVYLRSVFHMIKNDPATQKRQLGLLRLMRPKFFCLNDDMGDRPDPSVIELVRKFLEEYYPDKSIFEN